jgi:hypothetical protein
MGFKLLAKLRLSIYVGMNQLCCPKADRPTHGGGNGRIGNNHQNMLGQCEILTGSKLLRLRVKEQPLPIMGKALYSCYRYFV